MAIKGILRVPEISSTMVVIVGISAAGVGVAIALHCVLF